MIPVPGQPRLPGQGVPGRVETGRGWGLVASGVSAHRGLDGRADVAIDGRAIAGPHAIDSDMGRREQHVAKVAAFQALGKDLARRARSRCELCDQARSLQVLPVPPPDEAGLDAAILACGDCRDWVGGGRIADPAALRFLETAAWSETVPVQVAAVRLLRRLVADGAAPWAGDVLDQLWLPDEITERIDG